MRLTTYLQNKLANHVLKNTAYTPPTALYVALHTSDPTEAGNIGEVTTTAFPSYARKSLTIGTITNGLGQNSAEVTWLAAPAMIVTHFSVWDASTGGNALWYGPLNSAANIPNGDNIKFVTNDLTIGFD